MINRSITRILFFSLFLLLGSILTPAYAYKVTVKVKSATDSVAYLAHHYGTKQYVVDTTKRVKDTYTFSKTQDLDGGIYLIFFPSKKYFEFIVDGKSQTYNIKTDTADLQGKLVVENSPENQAFMEHHTFMSESFKKSEETKKLYEQAKKDGNKENETKYYKQLQDEDDARLAFRKNLMEKYKGTLWVNVLNTMYRPDVPELPRDENGKVTDSLFAYKYYKAHFFDNMPWNDKRILRTPVFDGKIMEYMDRLVMQHPDSLSNEATKIVGMAYKGDKEVFKYTLIKLAYKYETSKIMGQDAVFVRLSEDWYIPKKADWIDSATYAKIYDRTYKMKYNRIGLVAPELFLKDTLEREFTLSSVKADYTIVAFWDPNCGHCRKTIPKLKEMYDLLNTDGKIKVVAVLAEDQKADWKKFIREHKLDWLNGYDPDDKSRFRIFYDIYSFPVIYLLDKDKKILAKRLDVEQLEDLLTKLTQPKANIKTDATAEPQPAPAKQSAKKGKK